MIREAVLFGGVAALLTGAGVRLAWLERERGSDLREQARRQHTSTMTIPAQRGDILDARGRVLAGSVRRPSVFVDPRAVGDPRYAAYSLAPILGMNPLAIETILRERADSAFVWVRREISDSELRAFNALRKARRLAGFGIQHEPRRVYPGGRLAAHVIGFVGAEAAQPGLAGVEQAWDAFLRGVDGHSRSTVDARRRRVRSDPDDYRPPRDGATVVLTLDAHLQQVTEGHLRRAFEEHKAQWGTAVLIDPQTGEVLAMAVVPDFDPAEPVPRSLPEKDRAAAQERLRNRAVSDAFEPGSIFKPFIAAPAFDAGLTRLDELFAIHGPTRAFGGRTIRDVHPYGTLAMFEVISKSSNIGMGLIGARCGNERLHEWVRRFGFGDPTGVGLPGEHDGQLNDYSRWTSFSTQSIPIGQEISVTAIQLVAAFSALCNDGVLYRPRIVRGVVSAAGETLEDHSRPVPLRRVLDARAARDFRLTALAETVRSGTGKSAAIPGYRVFGKTGTAQIAAGGAYLPGAYVGSFLGGAPLEQPRLAVVVSLYRPSGGKYYGGTVSAPVAGAILADALTYMRVPQDAPAEGVRPAGSRRSRSAEAVDDAAE